MIDENKCVITGLPLSEPILNYGSMSHYTLTYYLYTKAYSQGVCITNDLINDPYFIKYRYILAGAIFNKLLSNEISSIIPIDKTRFEELIKKIQYPELPVEKLNLLLKTLARLQHFDGEVLKLDFNLNDPIFYYSLYFKNVHEFLFYFDLLSDKNLIEIFRDGYKLKEMHLTYEGLNYLVDISKNEINNKRCFIAMSFSENTTLTREAIREAVIKTGYEPVIIDEQHIDPDKTINDAIIAELKTCKFCIADFTEQKREKVGRLSPFLFCKFA